MRRRRVEPGEKLGQRNAVEPMGFAHAGKFGLVLFGLGKQNGIALFDQRRTTFGQYGPYLNRSGFGIEPDRFALLGQASQGGFKTCFFGQFRNICQGRAIFVGQFVFGQEQGGGPLGGNDGKAQDKGIMRDIAATHVEEPAQGFGQGEHYSIGTFLAHGGAQVCELVGSGFAGTVVAEDFKRTLRGRRAVGPDGIDRIGERNERDTGFLQRLADCGETARRVQPWIETDAACCRKVFSHPFSRIDRGRIKNRNEGGVGLSGCLQRIAAVDEERGDIAGHQSQPGRTGKAGEVGEPRVAIGDVFALMYIGTGYEEAIDAQLIQTGAERGKARSDLRGIGFFLERLELCVRNGGGNGHAGLSR